MQMLKVRPVRMHFSYNTEFGAYTPEAYERLLLDAIAGDATLFIRRDEVLRHIAVVAQEERQRAHGAPGLRPGGARL